MRRLMIVLGVMALSGVSVQAAPPQSGDERVPISKHQFRNPARGACLKRAFPQAMVVVRDETLRGPGITQQEIDRQCPRR